MLRATLAAVVLVALAGCSGLGGGTGGSTTPTVTPAPVPGPDAAVPDNRVAPGVSTDSVVAPGRLVASHETSLANTSYTYREQVTRRGQDGQVLRQATTVVRRNDTGVRYRYRVRRGTETVRSVERWSDGTYTYEAQTGRNRTVYTRRAGGIGLGADDQAGSLRRLFGLLAVTVDGSTTRDGQTVYRIETTEPQAVPPLEGVTFVGHVTPGGVVTDFRVAYDARRGVEPVSVSVQSNVSAVGATTVQRPEWYGTARMATNGTDTDDGEGA